MVERFDFYSPMNLTVHHLDKAIREQLDIIGRVDEITRKHSENVANLVCRICDYLRCRKYFTIYATICAYLHDVGKTKVPKEILTKDDSLTPEEYETMKTHTTLGYDICMREIGLKPYAAGPLYHHEALNGTGYPGGLTQKDIPYVAQIIKVADEYDALVTKRHYTTHIDISETLKILIKDAQPEETIKIRALEQLATNSKVGKINKSILKVLFKVVIDDVLYEISGVMEYVEHLKNQIKRLESIREYNMKILGAKKEKDIEFYKESIMLCLENDETVENYQQTLEDYKNALHIKQYAIAKLYDEIKIIKKLRV